MNKIGKANRKAAKEAVQTRANNISKIRKERVQAEVPKKENLFKTTLDKLMTKNTTAPTAKPVKVISNRSKISTKGMTPKQIKNENRDLKNIIAGGRKSYKGVDISKMTNKQYEELYDALDNRMDPFSPGMDNMLTVDDIIENASKGLKTMSFEDAKKVFGLEKGGILKAQEGVKAPKWWESVVGLAGPAIEKGRIQQEEQKVANRARRFHALDFTDIARNNPSVTSFMPSPDKYERHSTPSIERPTAHSTGLVRNRFKSQEEIKRDEEVRQGKMTDLVDWQTLPWVPGKRKDYSDLIEGVKYRNSELTNAATTGHMIAAVNNVPRLQGVGRVHFRSGSPYSSLAQKQYGNIMSGGRRVASATSDMNLATSALLQSQKAGSDTLLQGQYADIQRNDAVNTQQIASDQAVDKHNNAIANANETAHKDAMSKVRQLMANEELKSGNNRNALLAGWLQRQDGKANKDAQFAYDDYLFNNPNVAGSSTHMEMVEKEKQRFIDSYNASKGDFPGAPSFEESNEGKAWEAYRAEQYRKSVSEVTNRMNRLQLRAQMGYPAEGTQSAQKGGSLEEKKALENLKANHKKTAKHEEEFVKQILNNSKLIERALIKVFK